MFGDLRVVSCEGWSKVSCSAHTYEASVVVVHGGVVAGLQVVGRLAALEELRSAGRTELQFDVIFARFEIRCFELRSPVEPLSSLPLIPNLKTSGWFS